MQHEGDTGFVETNGMGREAITTFRIGGRQGRGRVHLDSACVLFPGHVPARVAFARMRDVRADSGVLHFRCEAGPVEIDLGAAAPRWAEGIVNPKSRLEKLGVKSGLRCAVIRVGEPGFAAEIRAATGIAAALRVSAGTDIVFIGIEQPADLRKLRDVRARMRDDAAVWIVHPKGKGATVRDDEVRQGIAEAGLVDVKIAAFSERLTSTKAMVPRAARARAGQTSKAAPKRR
jgi:hypothetical protein